MPIPLKPVRVVSSHVYIAGEFNIMGWNAQAEININLKSHIFINVSCDPLSFGPSTLFSIQRSESNSVDGPKFVVDVEWGLTVGLKVFVDIEGYVEN